MLGYLGEGKVCAGEGVLDWLCLRVCGGMWLGWWGCAVVVCLFLLLCLCVEIGIFCLIASFVDENTCIII